MNAHAVCAFYRHTHTHTRARIQTHWKRNKEISVGFVDVVNDGHHILHTLTLTYVLMMFDVNANDLVFIKGNGETKNYRVLFFWDDSDSQVGTNKKDKLTSYIYNLLDDQRQTRTNKKIRKQKTENEKEKTSATTNYAVFRRKRSFVWEKCHKKKRIE